jgi:hypothetical protein
MAWKRENGSSTCRRTFALFDYGLYRGKRIVDRADDAEAG